MIDTKMRSLLMAIFLTLAVSVGFVSGQTMQTASAANDALAALPASDAVIQIDVRRIMTEIVPRLLANDPATLGMLTSALNEASTKSGVNLLDLIVGHLKSRNLLER